MSGAVEVDASSLMSWSLLSRDCDAPLVLGTEEEERVRLTRLGTGDSMVSYLHSAECALQRSQGCSPLHFVLRKRQTMQARDTRNRLKPKSAASADDMMYRRSSSNKMLGEGLGRAAISMDCSK